MGGASIPDRRQALEAAFSVLADPASTLPDPPIPITTKQWRRSLLDAELDRRMSAYLACRARVSSASKANSRGLSRELRPAAIGLAEEAQAVGHILEALTRFDPGDSQAPALAWKWRAMVLDDAYDVLQAALLKQPPAAPPHWPDLSKVADEEERRDVLFEIFGISTEELQDEGGSFCDSRVLAFYRLRLRELQAICDPIMETVTERPPSVFAAVSAARDLATSTSPFVTLWTAREIRSLILTADDADPSRTRGILAQAAKDGDKEWESFRRLRDCLRRAEATRSSSRGTDSAYAFSMLEAYRHMAEGITRRWVGVLLLLTGLEGPPPGLGGLAEPATSRLGELGIRIEAALIPAMRNAEAHDDVVFDEDTGLLRSGELSFHPDEVEACLTDLDILQRGLILGRLGAFADRPELADGLFRTPDRLSAGSALAFARQRFGHAGQRVRSFVRDRDRLDIELDALKATACNPCFVALTQTAQVLPTVSHFVVKVRGREEVIMDLPASVLHQNWSVFEMAASIFPDGLPQSTFLPCLTWSRLACESGELAASVAAWIALNDAAHAILDANASITEYQRLSGRFQVVATSAGATIRVLPQGAHLEELLRVQRVTMAAARVFADNPRAPGMGVLTDRIFGLRDGLGGPFAVLPTLDPTPAPVSYYPHKLS